MRVIKPLRLSVLQRVLTMSGQHQLAVGLLAYFPFAAPEVVLPESSLWKQATKSLGKDCVFDEAVPKTRAEFLVFGKAYCPGGVARPAFAARCQVGPVDKSLYVAGNRRWKASGPTEPEPIAEMDLVWEKAFGGEGYAPNPVGIGFRSTEEGGKPVHLLPNLELPSALVTSPDSRPEPAGFGRLDPTWPPRSTKLGTYDAHWLEHEFPGFPHDFDPLSFQHAPADQWLPGATIDPDLAIVLDGLHPDKARLETRAPRLKARAFLARKLPDGPGPLEELATHLETLVLFPNVERAVAIFRGIAPVTFDDASDVALLVAALERPGEPRSIDHYRDYVAKRLDPKTGHLYLLRDRELLPEPDPHAPTFPDDSLSDMDELLAREGLIENRARVMAEHELDKARLQLSVLGIDPDSKLPRELPAPEPAPTLEELPEFAERLQKQGEAAQAAGDEALRTAMENAKQACAVLGLDFDKEVEKRKAEGGGPPKFRADDEIARMRELADAGRKAGAPMADLDARLADPAFRASLVTTETTLLSAYRLFAHFFPPAPDLAPAEQSRLRAEVEQAAATRRSLARRDLTGVDLRGLRLAGLDLTEALLERANLDGCDLSNANLAGAVLVRAHVGTAQLAGADLQGTNLGEVDASGASFEGANLQKAVFQRAKLGQASFVRTDLREANFLEADVRGADFSRANLAGVTWLEIDLAGVRFCGATLTKSVFVQCRGDGLDCSGALVEDAGFFELVAEHASFARARGVNFRLVPGAVLPDADFTEAELPMANLRGANLRGARFDRARLDGADLSEACLREATLRSASLQGALLLATDLAQADLSRSNLMEALLKNARVPGTKFDRANLFRANLLGAVGDDHTSFAGAHRKRVVFRGNVQG